MDVPDGTYKQSCGGCKLEQSGTLLECSHCTKPCGAKVISQILIADCVGGTIGNNAGTLDCSTPANAHADDIPDGTYKGSCEGCRLNGPDLVCDQCSRSDQTTTKDVTVTVGDCVTFGNSNGELTCDQRRSNSAHDQPELTSDSTMDAHAGEDASEEAAGEATTTIVPGQEHQEL